MLIYVCEDSLEGIFTGIYRAYEEKREPLDTALSLTDDPVLFAEKTAVEPDGTRAFKVGRTLRRRFGEDDYLRLCQALAAEDERKAQAVYRTVARGLETNCRPGHLFDSLADDNVQTAFSLARGAGREIGHLQGFVRFQELKDRILYAVIGPKNNVLTFLMPHFADRLPGENFVLFDRERNLFGVHPAYREWYLFQGETEEPVLCPTKEEERYRELFRAFIRGIEIQERRNPQLQAKLLPRHFREYMTEFQNAGGQKSAK